jgi:hypothetical protein
MTNEIIINQFGSLKTTLDRAITAFDLFTIECRKQRYEIENNKNFQIVDGCLDTLQSEALRLTRQKTDILPILKHIDDWFETREKDQTGNGLETIREFIKHTIKQVERERRI